MARKASADKELRLVWMLAHIRHQIAGVAKDYSER
jgi:hypothetical protein